MNNVTQAPKVKVVKSKMNMYRGYIYVDGKEIERTPEYMQEINCITWLNQRVDYHNARKKLNIPHYVKEFADETPRS
ncbi:hypothetical protein [Ursidibacter sp. B-7004-1]